MDTRDAFLNFARDKHYEFSSLRRAKFSTLALLYELHTSTTDKFNYNCNTCRQHCEVRYHCTECEDFDLCEKCYNIEPKHQHKMERSVPGVVDDGDQNSSNANGKSMATSQLQRQQSMQRCIDALLHAVNCRNANCFNRSCFRYKRVIQHTKECKGKNSQCNICKQVIFLCWYHAKSCMDQNCQVPFCTNLKTKIQKQRATSLQTDRRRMQAMMQQRTTSIHSQPQGRDQWLPVRGTEVQRADLLLCLVSTTPSTSSRTDSMSTSSFDSSTASSSMNNSSGKPSLTLVRAPQQANWHPQAYLMGQKPNTGKPMGGGPQASSSPLTVLINRVKQEQPMDESQRSDSTDQKPPMFSPLINKTPLNRLSTSALPTNSPQTTFNQPQPQQQQQQQWYSTTPQQQFVPPPNYTAATRARYTAVLPAQQQQNQGSPQTLLAPLRANISPPAYLARSSSSNSTFPRPNMNVTLSRPSPYSSSPSSSSQGQDPSPR